ncbi:unnamed protein product [Oncorhynchus mykiss]|uniref:Uncharacterized protein n=1 Tax=Oncorhynchus mykiss TaxID=8022 RepID=A0A060W9I4_ONCMY|nr:unnamed protein product [Oncorhynchus mykiss]
MMAVNVYDLCKYFCVCPLCRCYEVTSLESFPQCVSACWELLRSYCFCPTSLYLILYLSPSDEDKEEEKDQEDEQEREATGSSGYKPSANKNTKEPSTPVCVGELRRWAHGDYTLLHDGDASRAEYALDLLLPLSCPDWQTEFGGSPLILLMKRMRSS